MSRLTAYAKAPKAKPGAAAPHQYRLLGKRVLIADEHGRWALLSPEEHARLLRGLKPEDPLWASLQAKGFVAGAYDFDAASRRQFERTTLSWKGPSSFVLLLDRAKGGMTLDAARRIVDFVFRCPGPQITLEFVFADAGACWPVLWFLVQYARRKGEWSRRPVFLIARARAMTPEQADFLRSHGVTRSLDLVLDGAPDPSRAPAFRAQRARAVLSPGAREPRAWTQWFDRWGFESVKLEPSALDEDGVARFLPFYAEHHAWLVEHGETANLRDEWALAFLAGRAWAVPGVDVLEQLAVDAEGRVFTSEAAVRGAAELGLGTVDDVRYPEIARHGAVRAALAAALPDNQPQCSQCVYRPFCVPAPSRHLIAQGTVWGQTPSSSVCALHMGILDIIFSSINEEKALLLLDKWSVDMT